MVAGTDPRGTRTVENPRLWDCATVTGVPCVEEKMAEQQQQQMRKNARSVAALGQQDASTKLLEELVFGAEDKLLEQLLQVEVEPNEATSVVPPDDDDDDEEDCPQLKPKKSQKKEAAWVDKDDEQNQQIDMGHRFRRALVGGVAESSLSNQQLQQRMKERFQKAMGGAPSWAELSDADRLKRMRADDEDEDEEDEHDLLRKTRKLVASPEHLPSGILRMKKCCHANSAHPSENRLTTVQFHPNAQVVLTAGLDQNLSFFQVDGKTNPKIQSVHLDQFPVQQARFSSDGQTVMATSLRNRMFYLYHMIQGQVTAVTAIRGLNESRVKEFSVCPEEGTILLRGTRGYVHMLTLKTNEVVNSLKINGEVSDVAFTRDGRKVFIHSDEGHVHLWDVRSSRCLNVFTDDGCVKGTSLAASPDGHFLACGSQSGVVNIYSQETCLNSASPKPLKSFMNLLTPVTSMSFNPSSEILAVASRAQDEAVRLIHVPSLTVFSNFPVSKKKVTYRAACLDFSPHSGFFSLANDKGHAPLYRLLHYKDF